MRKTTVLFDIDGTLVDSNEAHVAAWREAFERHGFHFDREAIHEQIGKGGDNLVPSLIPDADEAKQQAIDDAHGDIFKSRYLPSLKPFPGARELLRRTKRAGLKVVLASSASREELDEHMRKLDAAGLVDATTSKDDVDRSKPAPDIFSKALAKVGADSSEAIVIGDSPYDLSAARRAGTSALALRSGGFPEEVLLSQCPIAIYDDAAELLAKFDQSPLAADQSFAAELGVSSTLSSPS